MKYKIGDIIKFNINENVYLQIVDIPIYENSMNPQYGLRFLSHKKQIVYLGAKFVEDHPKVTLDDIMLEEL
jgi:hypothetical protein